MYTKQEFLKLLKSKRELFAYVVINSDSGIYIKQAKKTWLDKVEKMNDSTIFELTVGQNDIVIN